MRVAAVSELKARLSEYLDHVKTGEEVVITDRGKPVARLIAMQRVRPERESLSRMARQGLIKIGSGKLRPVVKSHPNQIDRSSKFT